MVTLELAAERLEVVAKAQAKLRTAVVELLKASREEARMEELVEASKEVAKAKVKLTKLVKARKAVRSAAQVVVYAADDYGMAEIMFVTEVMEWESRQLDFPRRCPESDLEMEDGMPINASQLDGFCRETLTASQDPMLPLQTPNIHLATNWDLIQAPGHHRQQTLSQGPSSKPNDGDVLAASPGARLLSTRSGTDMGFSNADLPHRERTAIEAIHHNDVGFHMSSFSAGPSFSMHPCRLGADVDICVHEDSSFRKSSRGPYLQRREGPRPYALIVDSLVRQAEIFAVAVSDRLEAAEELIKVAIKGAGAKQKLHLNSLAKAKENLTKASEEVANAEHSFCEEADLGEKMTEPFLVWNRHRQEKKRSQKQKKTLRIQEERSLPAKGKRSRAQEERRLSKKGERSLLKKRKSTNAQDERTLERKGKASHPQNTRTGSVLVHSYAKCLNALRVQRGRDCDWETR